jgi:hypothetical protein
VLISSDFYRRLFLKAGAKVHLLFYLASFLESFFENKFSSSFLLILSVFQRTLRF